MFPHHPAGFHIAAGYGLVAPAPAPAPMLGATAGAAPANDTAKSIGAALQAEIEGKTGQTYETFEVTHMAVQRVAGTNYFLKIDVGDDAAVHARVFQGFDGSVQLVAVQSGLTAASPLVYFQGDSIAAPASAPAPRTYGAMKGVVPGDETAQAVADAVKDDIDAKCGGASGEHTVVEYATQLVAGTNYFLKIDRGDGEFVHARVYCGFDGSKQLAAVQAGKSADDVLKYFQDDDGVTTSQAPPSSQAAPSALGAASASSPANAAAQAAADAVRASVEEIHAPCSDYSVTQFKTQTVAGINFFLNVAVGNGEHIHLRVFRGFDGAHSLVAMRSGLTSADPLAYF